MDEPVYKMKVLVVEDNQEDFILTKRMFGEITQRVFRYSLEMESNGDRAIELINSGTYDICLLDYRLGPWNGLDILKSVKGCATPVLLLTGQGDFEVDQQAIQMGGFDYLSKWELSPSLLERAVRHALARKELIDRLRYQAMRDDLTDLFNRRHFFEVLDQQWSAANRHRYPLTLCICDIDHFKQINDVYGHSSGDTALQKFSAAMLESLRHEDIACRYGGDEFVILFPHIGLPGAHTCVERIRNKVRKMECEAEHDVFHITASFGLTALEPKMSIKEFLIRADKALYLAKETGRNRCHILTPTQSAVVQARD